MIDDDEQRAKWNQDRQEMQLLVKEGVTFARTMHGNSEPSCRIDADALLDSHIYDYKDSGQKVILTGEVKTTLMTRPNALRRILSNLIDNAIKYAGAAEVVIEESSKGDVTISVLDSGPGIPEGEMDAVFEPFYRLESSRNRLCELPGGPKNNVIGHSLYRFRHGESQKTGQLQYLLFYDMALSIFVLLTLKMSILDVSGRPA